MQCAGEIAEGRDDPRSKSRVHQQMGRHAQHRGCLGKCMGILGDEEHGKSFGAHGWNVKAILMTSCHTWDSGNRRHHPPKEMLGNSARGTGNRKWNKW